MPETVDAPQECELSAADPGVIRRNTPKYWKKVNPILGVNRHREKKDKRHCESSDLIMTHLWESEVQRT